MLKKLVGYGKQLIDDEDINAVIETLKSDFITQGSKIEEFENEICNYTGAKYCVAVSSGTAALHIAVKAIDIEKGKNAITSPITFCATTNAMLYNGLMPNFADIEIETGLISPSEIERKIDANTKLLIPVHYAGQPANMSLIKKIASKNDCCIIEDAAHGFGTKYPYGTKIGSCKYSDMTVLSFHPVKLIAAGEGGAITTNNKILYEKLKNYRAHGLTKSKMLIGCDAEPWIYDMLEPGFNYRMSDIHASLALSQLKKADKFIERRNEIAEKYDTAFADIPQVKPLELNEGHSSARHIYVLRINFDTLKITKKELVENLKKKNIGTQVHYIPVHYLLYYREKFGFEKGDYPKSEEFYEEALSIPLFPALTDREVDYIIKTISDTIRNAII